MAGAAAQGQLIVGSQVVPIGTAHRPMAGILTERVPVRSSLLLCRPIGLAAVRTTPMYRVMAERLDRDSVATLRFDYYGTGDSAGDEGDQSLDSWSGDVLSAHQFLVDNLSKAPAWFGMRLGANIALHAVSSARVPPARLILWDPILDGVSYLQKILAAHRREVADGKGIRWQQVLAKGIEPEPVLPGNVLGFQFGAELVRQLEGLSLGAITMALRREVPVTLAVRPADAAALRSTFDSQLLDVVEIDPQPDWSTSRADGTPVAPPDIFRTLRAALGLE